MNLYVITHGHQWHCATTKQPALRIVRLLKNKALIMRVSLLAMLLTLSGLLMAGPSEGQDLNKIFVSIDLKNATLKFALRKIEALAKLPFTYKTNDVARYENISYQASDITVAKLLQDLLQHTDLQYEQVNANIIIKKIKGLPVPPRLPDLNAPASPRFDGTVRGKVSNQQGEGVSAATVQVLGTNRATSADAQGNFVITGVPAGNHRLQISAVGYVTFTRDITVRDNEETTVNETLQIDAGGLNEVVVTALGIRREKKSLGYSTQEIKGDELLASRQNNIVNALRGKVAGVQINSGGGAPGQGSRIIIRGIKSLAPGKNAQPLFVIDGMLIDNSTTSAVTSDDVRGLSNRAADINPDDIETINILKGGAATALYGQAGSNGVVVITTRSARVGKMRVSAGVTYGIDEVNKFPDVQRTYTQGYYDATTFLPKYDSISFWPSWGPTVAEARAIDPSHPAEIYNHYAQGYQNGNQFRSNISLSGGTENALLTSSFSYSKTNGVIPNSDYKNISARIGGQFKFGNKLKLVPGIYFINSGGYRINADRYNESLTYWSPRWNVMDYVKPNGTMVYHGNNNPVFGTATNRYKDDVNRIIGNVALTFSPTSWLDIDYKLGMDYYADFRRHTAPGPKGIVGEFVHGDNGLGFVNEYRISNRILNSIAMATFKKTWDRFSLQVRGGNEVRDIHFSRLNATGSELDIPDLLTLNNTKVRTNSQFISKYRIVSAFGDALLGWDDFLFLNVTGRNEWTSALVQPNHSFFYPSASIAYVFTEHFDVMPNWLNFGKLRVSYAEIGKDTDPYETNSVYTSSVITSTGQIVWTRGDQQGNPALKPERTKTIEAGLEMRFLDNRIGFDFTWYNLKSSDLIIPVSISPTTGYTSAILNAGEIENKGVELVLSATPVKKKDFTWETSLNFTSNRNRVTKIREGLTEIVVGSHFGYSGATVTMKYVPGMSVGNIYGTSYARYYGDKTDDKVTLQKDLPYVIQGGGGLAGFPARDINQRLLGNSQPDWTGGITNTVTYRNFSLSFLWETQQGMERYNQLGNFMSAFGIATYTLDRTKSIIFPGVLADGSPNTQTVYLGQGKTTGDPRDYGQGYYRNIHRTLSENFVEDASWVRLRYLSLGYNVPKRIFGKLPISGATVTLTGNNLILITDYTGFDPESSSSPAGSNADGFTGFTYPALRSFLFSLNINF